MTDITACPQCGTHFRITPAQRNAHEGMVRCGKCQTVFNAVENLYVPQPQQLDLPLVMDEIADATGLFEAYDENQNLAALDSPVSLSPQAVARRRNDFSHLPDVELQGSRAHRPPNKLLWGSGITLLSILLLLETLYLFRIEIAAHYPNTRPVIEKICAKLKCTVPLPQKIDLINIESSELEADPSQASVITLHALIRSRAFYPVAYPNIELTLTDTLDNAVARRNFTPDDYLANAEAIRNGLPANRDTSIKLHLDTTDLKPAGYRLFLFYPQ